MAYLGAVSPRVQLADLIAYRNGLIREQAKPALIRSEIGRLAQAYHRYWEHEPGM